MPATLSLALTAPSRPSSPWKTSAAIIRVLQMSESEQPRDDATGQFTPSTEGLVGREFELVNAGYTVRKDPPVGEVGRTFPSDAEGIREAAAEYTALKPGQPTVTAPELIDANPNEALTVKQAADELTAARGLNCHIHQTGARRCRQP